MSQCNVCIMSLICLQSIITSLKYIQDGHHLDTDETTCIKNEESLQPNCSQIEFLCPGLPGHCIHKEKLCDGTEDCQEGTDEAPKVCFEQLQHCPRYMFKI